jgi:hypothetical protein
MTIPASRWLLRWRWALVAVSLPVLVGLWWAFRPEKLWVNQKVNEAAPFEASADPKPVLTGRFEAKAEQTSGRATIYQKPGGEEYLRLSDFSAPKGGDLHIELKGDSNGTDLGPLKNVQGDQNYDLPAAADPNKYEAVVIYSQQSHTVFGLAKLEPF